MEDDLQPDIRHSGHNCHHKGSDICFEYKPYLTDNQYLTHIPADNLRMGFQSIQANIDKILRHFVLYNLRSIHMDLEHKVWTVRKQAIVVWYIE
jgi:hypothetical protein